MHGHLDACSCLEASGWAYAPEAPGRTLTIEAHVDGQPVARGQANLLRPDLAAAGIGDGRHAYRLSLPPSLHDGAPHQLRMWARLDDAVVELQGSPLDFVSPPSEAVRGALHILPQDGLVAGWAYSRMEPGRRLRIGVTANGVAQRPVLADQYRHDLQALGLGDGHHGFQVPVATAALSGPTLDVIAIDLDSGALIPPGPVSEPLAGSYWASLQQEQMHAAEQRAALQATAAAAAEPVLLSVLMPVYRPGLDALRAAMASVRAQTWPHWQLCVADDASDLPEVQALLTQAAAADARISLTVRADNGHISAASNSALALARGAWVVLLDHDDLLHPDALLHLAAAIAKQPDLGLLFSDEDKCDEQGIRYRPYGKPGWNPDLMLGQNMVSHLGAYRADLVRQVGGFRLGLEGSQDYDLALRVRRLLAAQQIRHIPQVLYHWRAVAGSTARTHTEKSYAAVALRRALRDDLRARGENGRVSARWGGVITRFRPALPSPKPGVAVVLGPWVDRRQRRHQALQAVQAAAWPGVACTGMAPGDGLVPVAAALAPEVQVLVWLGPQVRPRKRHAGWLRELVAQALRPGVGVVGAKVLDAQGHIASFGHDAFSGRLQGLPAADPGPFGVALLCRTVQGLGGHAWAVRRGVLEAWAARAAGNGDVPAPAPDAWAQALCDQAHALGLRCLVTPDAHMTLLPLPEPAQRQAPTD